MDDLISRQAAIEALDEQIENCDKSLSSFDISMKDAYAVKVERASLVAFREILEYLPPALPERGAIEQIKWERDVAIEQLKKLGYGLGEKIRAEKDCISRQAALDIFDDYNVAVENGQIEAYSRDRKRLCELPPAEPQIIYCKDCAKHNKVHGRYYDGEFVGMMDCCPLTEIRGRAQGHEFDYQFCAYAERRTE